MAQLIECNRIIVILWPRPSAKDVQLSVRVSEFDPTSAALFWINKKATTGTFGIESKGARMVP